MHERLREATREPHAAAELAMDIDRRLSSRNAYCALLRQLWRLHVGYERCLAGQEWARVGIEFEERRRAGLLERDIAALGGSIGDIQPVAPAVRELPEAIGCLYVLEGSTMGGQIILRRARKTLGLTPALGGSFFSAYGSQTRPMWSALVEAINRLPPFGPMADAVELGAVRTFRGFIAVLGSQS